ncbi:MAG: hypothetical protein JOZ19_07105 [Rubrobacter sp.]|nr:hypothetical protein [Rubrobacter sp.]
MKMEVMILMGLMRKKVEKMGLMMSLMRKKVKEMSLMRKGRKDWQPAVLHSR